MKAALPIVLVALLAFGSVSEQQREYVSWAAKPAPKSWRLGQTWAFVLLDKKGAILGSMTVRFTDQKAVSCLAGNWNRVETIRQQGARILSRPLSYTLDGTALSLSANDICDAYEQLVGELKDNGVAGQYIAFSIMRSESLGSFYGVPIEN